MRPEGQCPVREGPSLGKSEPRVLSSSFSSLVFDKYMTISGFQIEETIDRETSGNLEQLLLAVGR